RLAPAAGAVAQPDTAARAAGAVARNGAVAQCQRRRAGGDVAREVVVDARTTSEEDTAAESGGGAGDGYVVQGQVQRAASLGLVVSREAAAISGCVAVDRGIANRDREGAGAAVAKRREAAGTGGDAAALAVEV